MSVSKSVSKGGKKPHDKAKDSKTLGAKKK